MSSTLNTNSIPHSYNSDSSFSLTGWAANSPTSPQNTGGSADSRTRALSCRLFSSEKRPREVEKKEGVFAFSPGISGGSRINRALYQELETSEDEEKKDISDFKHFRTVHSSLSLKKETPPKREALEIWEPSEEQAAEFLLNDLISAQNLSAEQKKQISSDLAKNIKKYRFATINKEKRLLKELGEGKNHKVFELLGEDKVVKLPHPDKKPRQQEDICKDAVKAYDQLCAQGYNVPAYDISPASNVNYWILEKMPSNVDNLVAHWKNSQVLFDQLPEEAQKLLRWVKSVLSRSKKEGQEIINDFYPKNVMLNKNGEYCIVDFSPCDNDDFKMNFDGYIKGWSEKNPNIKTWLES